MSIQHCLYIPPLKCCRKGCAFKLCAYEMTKEVVIASGKPGVTHIVMMMCMSLKYPIMLSLVFIQMETCGLLRTHEHT